MKSINSLISIIFTILISTKQAQCNIALQTCLQMCQQNTPNPEHCIKACVSATTINGAPNNPQQQHYQQVQYHQQQYQQQPVTATSNIQTEYILVFLVLAAIVGIIWYNQNQRNFQVDLNQQNIRNELHTQERVNQVRYDNIQQDHQRYDADINDNRTDIRTLAVGQNGLQALAGQLRADHDAHRLEYNRALENQNMLNREITGNLATQTSNLNSLQLEFNHSRDQFYDFRDRSLGFNQAISNQVHENQANIQAVQHQVEQQQNNPLQQILGFLAPFAAPILGGVGRQTVRAIANDHRGSSRNMARQQRPARRNANRRS